VQLGGHKPCQAAGSWLAQQTQEQLSRLFVMLACDMPQCRRMFGVIWR